MDTNPRAIVGGNNPPVPIDFVETTLAPLTELRADEGKASDRVAALVRNSNSWKENVPEIQDAETASSCEGFLTQLRAEWKALDDLRAAAVAPIDEHRKKVHTTYKAALDLLEACGNALKPLKEAWLKREDERLRREAAERARQAAAAQRAAEEAEQAARAKDAPVEAALASAAASERAEMATKAAQDAAGKKAAVVSEYSPRASGLRSRWACTISDWPEAAKALSSDAAVREAIQKAANKMAAAQKAALQVGWGQSKEDKVV